VVHRAALRRVETIRRFGLIAEADMSTLNELGFEGYGDAAEKLQLKSEPAAGIWGEAVALVFTLPKNLVVPEAPYEYSIARGEETQVSEKIFREFMAAVGQGQEFAKNFQAAWGRGDLLRTPPRCLDGAETFKLNLSLAEEGLISRECLTQLTHILSAPRTD
jgi:hypothetical protein